MLEGYETDTTIVWRLAWKPDVRYSRHKPVITQARVLLSVDIAATLFIRLSLSELKI